MKLFYFSEKDPPNINNTMLIIHMYASFNSHVLKGIVRNIPSIGIRRQTLSDEPAKKSKIVNSPKIIIKGDNLQNLFIFSLLYRLLLRSRFLISFSVYYCFHFGK